jgi:hypothetical protein
MNKTWATIAVIAAVPILALGIIFLIATISTPSRILPAAVFLGVGYLLINAGFNALRRLAQISPEALATGIVELAKRLGGEVTVSQVQAEFKISTKKAIAALEESVGKGECIRDRRQHYDAYVFKGVMPAKAIKRCGYCGSEFAVKSDMRQCPNCGATLEIVKE